MTIRNDIVEAIGNTPLIKLRKISEETGCTILGKAEFMNPGQSVKDRPARQMVLEAEARGDLKPDTKVLVLARKATETNLAKEGFGLVIELSPSDAVRGRKGRLEKLAVRAIRRR